MAKTFLAVDGLSRSKVKQEVGVTSTIDILISCCEDLKPVFIRVGTESSSVVVVFCCKLEGEIGKGMYI